MSNIPQFIKVLLDVEKILVFESKEQAERAIPLNQIKKIRINKRELCLANTSNGFIAFDKNCPHLGEDLSRGTLNPLGEVVCPWHSYRFALSSGEETDQRCNSLPVYTTAWEEGELYLFL